MLNDFIEDLLNDEYTNWWDRIEAWLLDLWNMLLVLIENLGL